MNFIEEETEDQTLVPKFLYDCLLGLRSEVVSRVNLCLKHLPYLVRNNLDDLDLLWKDLALQLFNVDFEVFQDSSAAANRDKALQALVILKPRQMAQ